MSDRLLSILTLGQLIVDRPCRAHALSRLGIDCWCNGRKNLPRVCAENGLKLDDVLKAVQTCDQAEKTCDQDCARRVLLELIDHIEQVHHVRCRAAVNTIQSLLDQAVSSDTAHCPKLPRLRDAFSNFTTEIIEHMAKEEQVLFAACRSAATSGITRPQFDQAMSDMLDEHGHSSHSMETMRSLTDDYTPPPAATPACRALFDSLRNLEDDLHRHVFEENNILTPLALSLAKTLP